MEREWPRAHSAKNYTPNFELKFSEKKSAAPVTALEKGQIALTMCSFCVLWVRVAYMAASSKAAEVKRRASERSSHLAFSKLLHRRRHNSNSPLIRDNGGVKP
jgi:hypothetical protein